MGSLCEHFASALWWQGVHDVFSSASKTRTDASGRGMFVRRLMVYFRLQKGLVRVQDPNLACCPLTNC